ncbi:hypothetical protein Y1Q_0002359 [Alligator mississippiensis]|uniref:Uncharacterized protein n=1 Tax=Alligator mississippiensis TaxID=8496 RepID=A0A151MGU6_ALLMI|nr:hypothetical protein Y1Q_0002359 [Alligator mississippiensis]
MFLTSDWMAGLLCCYTFLGEEDIGQRLMVTLAKEKRLLREYVYFPAHCSKWQGRETKMVAQMQHVGDLKMYHFMLWIHHALKVVQLNQYNG